MLPFPPIPSWDAMHPLIIHFPIVLLLLAPLFVLVSAALPAGKNHPYMLTALIILLLGTGSLFLAASSGEEAAELADRGGGVKDVLADHEDMASKTEVVFSALSLALLGLFLWPRLMHRQETRIISTVLPLSFLALYSVGVLFLVNTAHAGGRLVHEFGVHAILPQAGQRVSPSPAPANSAEHGETD